MSGASIGQAEVPPFPRRTLDDIPNNLPRPLTSFIGREHELAEARRLLGNNRLLTLTGPGGSGKTRLCIRLAAEVAGDFPDGVYFVPLAPVREPGLVPSSIAQYIGLQDFDPEAVRRMKAQAHSDISVGGPELAAQAIRAGLVDEYHVFVTPVVVGGGKHFLPDGLRLKLELLDERRFGSGVVHLHYRTAT
jgi:RibD C-terminal domain